MAQASAVEPPLVEMQAEQAGQFPQLAFQIGNPQAPNTIYITTEPEVNRLTLAITTNVEAKLTPGEPVPRSRASSAGGTLLYLSLRNLNLSDREFEALKPAAEGWQFRGYVEERTLCMTPTEEMTLQSGPGNELSLAIEEMTIANPPGEASVTLTVTYFRVQGITTGNLGIPTNFKALLVQAPTGEEKLSEAIAATVIQPYVVNSVGEYPEVTNSLSLLFSPGPTPRTVRASRETLFELTFVYAEEAPGYGALCDLQRALRFEVTAGQNADGWVITKGTNKQNPSWLLQPPAEKPIVGSGAQSTVELEIANIITELAPGSTAMFVSYRNVPGYQDDCYAIPLQKVPHVQISRLEVIPNPTVLQDGQATVTLRWRVENGGTLTLMPLYKDVTGKESTEATIEASTVFTLEAQGLALANAGNRAIRNVTADVLPVINSFEIRPLAIFSEDFPRTVELEWNVNTGGKVELLSSAGPRDPNLYRPVLSVNKSLIQPQMVTLVPVEDPDDPLVRRSLIISAFAPQVSMATLSAGASSVAIPPNAGFVVLASLEQNSIRVLDSIVYRPITNEPVNVGEKPVDVAFSPSGEELYVANSGDGTVSVIEVRTTGALPPYTFTTATTLRAGGNPQRVTTSPDGRYVYVAVDNGTAAGSLVVAERRGAGQLHQVASLTVGQAPRGIAVAPSGARVFVSNSADDTVSVIGVSSGGRHSLVDTLEDLRSQPEGLAVSSDGAVLLVVCRASNTVFAINAQYPDRTPRKPLTVGAAPRDIALVPGGAYALVSNSGDGSASLLSVSETTRACTVLQGGLRVGGRPAGVAVSPEAGLALIACEGEGGLGVITLAEYQQSREPVNVVGEPTSLAITPDGAKVLVWHNSLITLGGQASTGFSVYETESQTTSEQAQGQELIELAVSPLAETDVAFAIARGRVSVQALSTKTYQPLHEIELGTLTKGTPRNVALSADGRLLFVLACDEQRQYDLLPFEINVARGTYKSLGAVRAFTTSVRSRSYLLAAPDGSAAYAIDSADGNLWTFAHQRGGGFALEGSAIKIPKQSVAAVITPDGRRIFTLGQGSPNTICAIDTETQRTLTIYLPGAGSVALNGLAISPDGLHLFATDGVQAGIRVFDAMTLRLLQTISWTSEVSIPYGLAVMPDGSQIFTANAGSSNLGVVQQVQPAPSTGNERE